MSGLGEETPPALDKTLRRIEELTAALYQGTDTRGREAARELLEVILDLHSLGLARISAIVAASENGAELTRLLAADPYARAIMLLHDLHPLSLEERLRETISQMRPKWSERGIEVRLLRVSSATARIRICKNGEGDPAELFGRDVESVLINAAPDLDDIVVEFDDGPRDRAPDAIEQYDGRRIEA
jgi:signal transduction histidine kinase